MTMPVRVVAFVIGLVVIAFAGFSLGGSLKGDRAEGFRFDFDNAAYEANSPAPRLSKGGFSGFGETPGLEGQTQLAGTVVSVDAQQVVIESPDGIRASLRLNEPRNVRRIEASGPSAIRPGSIVVVRYAEGSSAAEAILLLEVP